MRVLVNASSASVLVDGKSYLYSSEDTEYQKIVDAVAKQDVAAIKKIVTERNDAVSNWTDKVKFKYVDGLVEHNGVKLPYVLSEKIVNAAKSNLPYEPFLKFYDKLMLNPSYRSRLELYDCLLRNHHPLTSDGCFLAYKKVRNDFKDYYSGQFDNKVGNIVSMERGAVDDNRDHECSAGLHVATWDYAANVYNPGCGNLLLVAVNPADVVSVPLDHNAQKIRVSKYKVVRIHQGPELKELLVNDIVGGV